MEITGFVASYFRPKRAKASSIDLQSTGVIFFPKHLPISDACKYKYIHLNYNLSVKQVQM